MTRGFCATDFGLKLKVWDDEETLTWRNTLPDCFASCLWINIYKHADRQVLHARVAIFVIKVEIELQFRMIFVR